MSETIVNYDNVADILRVQFVPSNDTYVHYWDDYFATLHDALTDKVVGLHIEAWQIFKDRAYDKAKEIKAQLQAFDDTATDWQPPTTEGTHDGQ